MNHRLSEAGCPLPGVSGSFRRVPATGEQGFSWSLPGSCGELTLSCPSCRLCTGLGLGLTSGDFSPEGGGGLAEIPSTVALGRCLFGRVGGQGPLCPV